MSTGLPRSNHVSTLFLKCLTSFALLPRAHVSPTRVRSHVWLGRKTEENQAAAGSGANVGRVPLPAPPRGSGLERVPTASSRGGLGCQARGVLRILWRRRNVSETGGRQRAAKGSSKCLGLKLWCPTLLRRPMPPQIARCPIIDFQLHFESRASQPAACRHPDGRTEQQQTNHRT
eukprot:scaffold537_cov241-Pinguiococcus_pyrenoidosus.AAC.16